MKKKIIILLLAVLVAAVCVVLAITGKDTQQTTEKQDATEATTTGGYTWEDYLAMSLEEREAFFQEFESLEAFEAWLKTVQPEETIPFSLEWDKPGKTPDAYSWEEYRDLSYEDQERFYQWFGSRDAFEAWMNKVKPEETVPADMEWNKPGKKPDEYTWDEYAALSSEDQEAFYNWFADEKAFNTWMNTAKSAETSSGNEAWDKQDKQPDAYTWEEYQKLSGEEQEKFYKWFDSVSAFEDWMNSVKPKEDVVDLGKWNKPGKKPKEYTWEEYQELSMEDQERFYQWFSSLKAFENWMKSVKPEETTSTEEKWNKPGKKPNEYTWEEYQKLTPEEQDLFFLWFESIEAFEAWMAAAKGE